MLVSSFHIPCATLNFTSRSTGVDTTDLVITRMFSTPITITRYGNTSLRDQHKFQEHFTASIRRLSIFGTWVGDTHTLQQVHIPLLVWLPWIEPTTSTLWADALTTKGTLARPFIPIAAYNPTCCSELVQVQRKSRAHQPWPVRQPLSIQHWRQVPT